MKPRHLTPLVRVPEGIRNWPICAADLGFATKNPTVGLACTSSHDNTWRETKTFAQAVACVQDWLTALQKDGKNNAALVLEAPLSMAFNQQENPCCRNIELSSNYQTHHKPSSTKGWFYGAGAILANASQVFLSRLKIPSGMTIHLAEGFYTKIRGIEEPHVCDRSVAVHLRDRLIGLAGQSLPVPISGSSGGMIRPLLGLQALGLNDHEIPGIVFHRGLLLESIH